MSSIELKKTTICSLHVDAIVNAANEGLKAGGGVCGAIFTAAGMLDLQRACERIGYILTIAAEKTKIVIYEINGRVIP